MFLLNKTSTAHPASRQPGHGASTPEAALDTVAVGHLDEAVSSREVNLISANTNNAKKYA